MRNIEQQHHQNRNADRINTGNIKDVDKIAQMRRNTENFPSNTNFIEEHKYVPLRNVNRGLGTQAVNLPQSRGSGRTNPVRIESAGSWRQDPKVSINQPKMHSKVLI